VILDKLEAATAQMEMDEEAWAGKETA
jgi:hypothetical protein